jgi:hypothetical protein
MAQIKTVVSLERKEIEDAVIELAKGQLDKCIGGAVLEWQQSDGIHGPAGPTGAIVSFTGNVKT